MSERKKIDFEYNKTFTTSIESTGYAEIDPLRSDEKQDYGHIHLAGRLDDLTRRQRETLRVDVMHKLSELTGWDKDELWSYSSVSGVGFIHIKDPELNEQYKGHFETYRTGFLPASYISPRD